jgi:hypothetical protein
MHNSFMVVRSKNDSDATVRLQSDPVLRGLKSYAITAELVDPNKPFDIQSGSCVLFHFDDAAAVEGLRRARKSNVEFTAACFGSDIYRLDNYLASYDVADMYIMPTELHRQVLASQIYKPVYSLPESIDPIAQVKEGSVPSFPSKCSTRTFWFGYPESFNKGMASLIPVIKMNGKAGHISDFSLILNEQEFLNEHRFRTIPFRKEYFRADAMSFDYCIMSHFALDLCLNSYIKSPNKLITALMVGLIPIASNTPSYRTILSEFGLDRFLFDSPSDLDRILRNLDPIRDSEQVAGSGIVEVLTERYSDTRLAENLLAIFLDFDTRDKSHPLSLKPRSFAADPTTPTVSFSEHLRDLFPSFRRSMRWRLKQLRG